MKYNHLICPDIDTSAETEFRTYTLKTNLGRTKAYAIAVIVFDLILSLSDIITYLLKTKLQFQFIAYLTLYFVMILVNTLILIFIYKTKNLEEKPAKYLKIYENVLLLYITFMLCWGSIVTLMDQPLYGQLTVFMINMIVCSVLYYIENKKIIISYSLSVLILFAGLPFVQSSGNVLIGHYINLTVFIIISYICSRVLFSNFCRDFNNKIMLDQMHKELHRLSYLDELTCLPNRRSFNHFIESNYISGNKKDTSVSVIMLDIDFFKQYNDHYGHVAGDKVLIKVADQISSMLLGTDHFAARIGGEEFIFIAENISKKDIHQIAEQLRQKIMDLKISHEFSGYGYLTISSGVSQIMLQSDNDINECIENADKALYFAKKSGRNCVKSYQDVIVGE